MTSTTLTYSNLALDQALRIAQIVADELSRDAGSSNGRTAGFESVDAGSTPAPATNSEQDDSAIGEVKGKARLPNAIGVEPLPSFISSPAITAGDDGHPSTPTIDARAAGQGGSSHCMAQSIEAVTNLRKRKPLRPFCQSPDDLTKCAGRGREHCHACTKAMAQSEAA